MMYLRQTIKVVGVAFPGVSKTGCVVGHPIASTDRIPESTTAGQAHHIVSCCEQGDGQRGQKHHCHLMGLQLQFLLIGAMH